MMYRKRIYFAILYLGMLSGTVIAGDRLTVASTVESVELGKPFVLNVMTSLKTPSLARIDLSPLQKDFVIKEVGDVSYSESQEVQMLRLRLYARDTGIFTIPELKFEGRSSYSFPVRIEKAIDPKTKKPVDIKFEFKHNSPWVRQQWILKVTITSADEIIILKTEQPDLENFRGTVIEQSSYHNVSDGKYLHKTGWVLFPGRAGTFDLDLPAIKYYRDGVNTHNFYPPRLTLNVKPLPAYIPGTVPVGKLSLRLDGPDNPFLIRGNLHSYKMEIVGHGIQAVDMPVITMETDGQEQTLHYQSKKLAQQVFAHHRLDSRILYTFPFVSVKSGLITFSGIRLQYFDPDDGRLHAETFYPGTWFSLPYWLAILLLLSFVGLVFYIVRLLINWLAKKWRYLRICKSVISVISSTDDCADFKKALQVFAGAEGWLDNPSMLQIKRTWKDHYPHNAKNIAVFDLLMRRLYRGDDIDVNVIRNQLLLLIYSRAKIFRYI